MFIYRPTAFAAIWLLLSNYGSALYVTRDAAHGPVVYTGHIAVAANLPAESNPATDGAVLQWYAQKAYSEMSQMCTAASEQTPSMMAVMYHEEHLYFSSAVRNGYGYAYFLANAPVQVRSALTELDLPHNTGSCAEIMTTAVYWREHPTSVGTLRGAVMAVYGKQNGGASLGAATPCSGDGVLTVGCTQYLDKLGVSCEGRNGYGKRIRSNHFKCPEVPIAARQPAQTFPH